MSLNFFGLEIGTENNITKRKPVAKEYHIKEAELLNALNITEPTLLIAWNTNTRTLIIRTTTETPKEEET